MGQKKGEWRNVIQLENKQHVCRQGWSTRSLAIRQSRRMSQKTLYRIRIKYKLGG